ncbi:hypothetical protein OIU78_025192 [Salix suchowensis]|nr:B-box zinc finger protein [Salix suchowensis]KAJ6293158.1 hypothetical protein OIU78_025192 [Salix suchowensis]
MKGCELCGSSARMFCESDKASLCWDCDEKVHSANFLVAKHCRTLLCKVCQSPTPWKASGSKFAPTVSICESCFTIPNKTEETGERMKGCELCGGSTRMFCESDQASLCWDCDEKVHSANFLVAKHCRTLLCKVCQSPTPWKASGSKFAPTVSICESCFTSPNNKRHIQDENVVTSDQVSQGGGNYLDESENDQEFDGDGDTDDDSDEDEEEEEEDGDDQVVPWSGPTAPSSSSPAPPLASSSSEEETSCAGRNGFLKRTRESNVDLDSDGEIGCSSSHKIGGGRLCDEKGNSLSSSRRPWKQARTSVNVEEDDQAGSRSTAIIETIERLQRDMFTNGENASAAIPGICSRMSRDQSH